MNIKGARPPPQSGRLSVLGDDVSTGRGIRGGRCAFNNPAGLGTVHCRGNERIECLGSYPAFEYAGEHSLTKESVHHELLSGMQKGNLDSVTADAHGKIKKETVVLQGVSVTRVTFDIGAKWSNDLKEYAGTNSCQLPHVALVLSGTLRVVMDDGSQQDFSKNDVMLLPPGHDAWSVGSEPCVFVEFSRGNDYYEADHSH